MLALSVTHLKKNTKKTQKCLEDIPRRHTNTSKSKRAKTVWSKAHLYKSINYFSPWIEGIDFRICSSMGGKYVSPCESST